MGGGGQVPTRPSWDLTWLGGYPPPIEVWTDTQSENITSRHPSDAGGKYATMCFVPERIIKLVIVGHQAMWHTYTVGLFATSFKCTEPSTGKGISENDNSLIMLVKMIFVPVGTVHAFQGNVE